MIPWFIVSLQPFQAFKYIKKIDCQVILIRVELI